MKGRGSELFEGTKEEKLAGWRKRQQERRKARLDANMRTCQGCTRNELTHFPKDPNCKVCARSKMTKRHCRPISPSAGSLGEPKFFGDQVTMDHKVMIEPDEGCTYFAAEKRQRKASSCGAGPVHPMDSGVPCPL